MMLKRVTSELVKGDAKTPFNGDDASISVICIHKLCSDLDNSEERGSWGQKSFNFFLVSL
jgi:hypothetical protein